uniref:Uncharacterized protein n=1 Tax=Oryza punctata TaxID=4537 RepID=A0A0E0MIK7_ORYPU
MKETRNVLLFRALVLNLGVTTHIDTLVIHPGHRQPLSFFFVYFKHHCHAAIITTLGWWLATPTLTTDVVILGHWSCYFTFVFIRYASSPALSLLRICSFHSDNNKMHRHFFLYAAVCTVTVSEALSASPLRHWCNTKVGRLHRPYDIGNTIRVITLIDPLSHPARPRPLYDAPCAPHGSSTSSSALSTSATSIAATLRMHGFIDHGYFLPFALATSTMAQRAIIHVKHSYRTMLDLQINFASPVSV